MWLDTENEQDPYNRINGATQTAGTPNTSIGAGGGTSSPGGGTTAGTAASGTSSNPSTTAPAQTTGPTQNFATVQDYLGANQNQGEALGQKVTGALDQAATADQGAIAGAVNQTQSDINSGTVNANPDLINKAVATPTAITSDPNQLNDFLGQWNAAYTGPSSFETSNNYGAATAANTDAQQKQAEVATAGGQQQLLNNQFNVYGQGNQGLDQALLQNSSSEPKLQGEVGNFQNVQDYLTNQATNLDTAATAGQTTSDATKAAAQSAFANEPATFQNQINSEVAAAQTPAEASAAQFQTDFASGDPTKVIADLKQTNPNVDAQTISAYLTAMNTQTGKPTDLSQFYNYNPQTAITTANAATAQDYANAAAYGKLTGVDYSGVLNPANAAQAGTATNATSGINPGGANVGNYLTDQYANALLAAGGSQPLKMGTPGTPGTPGIPGTPATQTTFQPSMFMPGTSNGVTIPIGTNPAALAPMQLPANASPAAMKTLISTFQTPLSTAGTYGEGAIVDAASRLQTLQGLVTSKDITQQEFTNYAQPIIDWAKARTDKISSEGSSAANAVNPQYAQILKYGSPTPATK
jgi:hypothetical protein